MNVSSPDSGFESIAAVYDEVWKSPSTSPSSFSPHPLNLVPVRPEPTPKVEVKGNACSRFMLYKVFCSSRIFAKVLKISTVTMILAL